MAVGTPLSTLTELLTPPGDDNLIYVVDTDEAVAADQSKRIKASTLFSAIEASIAAAEVTAAADAAAADANAETRVSKAGDTMTGGLILPASDVGSGLAPLTIPPGSDPDNLDTGQVWLDSTLDQLGLRGAVGGARYLHDTDSLPYEEGTWTPAFSSSGVTPTITYDVQDGYYTRIGRMVAFQLRVDWSAKSGGSGAIRLSLPFTAGAYNSAGGVAIRQTNGWAWGGGTGTYIGAGPAASGDYLEFRAGASGVNAATMNTSDLPSVGLVIIGGTFFI